MPLLELNRQEQKTLQEALQQYMNNNRSPEVWLPGQQTLAALSTRSKTPGPVKAMIPPRAGRLLKAAMTDYTKRNEGSYDELIAKLPD